MTKYIQIFIILLTLSACGQNVTEMKTPENANEKFAEFTAKKKFVEENFYPGIVGFPNLELLVNPNMCFFYPF